MSGWTAVIPIKAPGARKTRLREQFDAAAVDAVADAMLRKVLHAAAQARLVRQVVVLAPERPAAWAGRWLKDAGEGLNAALSAAARTLPGPLLVLAADLPTLAPSDVDGLLAAAGQGAAIAPDRDRRGTNALALQTAAGFGFAFGCDSFARHRERLPGAAIVPTPGLAFDLDWPRDLAEARSALAGQAGFPG